MLPDTSRAKFPHRVYVTGCDDRTEVTIDLTPDEFAAVRRFAEAVNDASTCDCQPKVEVVV